MSSPFTADWLLLREPADSAARSTRVALAVADALPRDMVDGVDLATGTGSNMRYLADFLPSRQEWRLVDHDRALLNALGASMQHWATGRGYAVSEDAGGMHVRGPRLAAHLVAQLNDLARIERVEGLEGARLVTASALLDLVSEAWMRALIERCREANAVILFALSYDGRIACAPEEPEDDVVRSLVNDHQQRDKGFGPALGPEAVDVAAALLESAGYTVRRETSDWVLTADSARLQRVLIDGWADAAIEVAPGMATAIHDWRARRLAHVDARTSCLTVGHVDLGAWLK